MLMIVSASVAEAELMKQLQRPTTRRRWTVLILIKETLTAFLSTDKKTHFCGKWEANNNLYVAKYNSTEALKWTYSCLNTDAEQ